MRRYITGNNGKPIDVTEMQDAVEEEEIQVEPKTVFVKVGQLEIRHRGGNIPWDVEILLDGVPVKKAVRIDLCIAYGALPIATINVYT